MTQPTLKSTRLALTLKYLPRSAQKMAVIGPGREYIQNSFQAFNPQSEIETFGDLQDLKNESEKYDCVVVLEGEYLQAFDLDVWGMLKSSLIQKGTLIVDIANPLYFRKINEGGKTLLSLDGILQKANQFSKQIKQTFSQTGFQVDRVLRNRKDESDCEQWQQTFGLKNSQDNMEWKELVPILQTHSFLHRLTLVSFPKVNIQSQILKPTGGVNDVRIHEPLAALQSLPGFTAQASRAERLLPPSGKSDRIFLWHRPVLSFEKSVAQIQALRKAGYLIVTEFDDHHTPWPAIQENEFLSFAGVHAVQTTKAKLADIFRPHNPEVEIFPNQLDMLPPRDLSQPSDQARLFFGALNRKKDWQPMMAGLNKALSEAENPFFFDVVFDQEFFEALETENKKFTPHCTYRVYKSLLSKADISLMPLGDTRFNEMKSDLKLVEAVGHGAVPVASPVVYGEDLRHKEFTVFCMKPDDFGEAVAVLIGNPMRRIVLQRQGREYVKNFRLLCHDVNRRRDWYYKLLQNKDQLDQALEHRLRSILPH